MKAYPNTSFNPLKKASRAEVQENINKAKNCIVIYHSKTRTTWRFFIGR